MKRSRQGRPRKRVKEMCQVRSWEERGSTQHRRRDLSWAARLCARARRRTRASVGSSGQAILETPCVGRRVHIGNVLSVLYDQTTDASGVSENRRKKAENKGKAIMRRGGTGRGRGNRNEDLQRCFHGARECVCLLRVLVRCGGVPRDAGHRRSGL